LKRSIFIYLPIFTLVCFLSSTVILPSSSYPSSNPENTVIKNIILGDSHDKNLGTAEVKDPNQNAIKSDCIQHDDNDDTNQDTVTKTTVDARTTQSNNIGMGDTTATTATTAATTATTATTATSTSSLPLDFLVAGFAKSGSTSLLHLFDHHVETSVVPSEVCAFNSDMAIVQLSTLLEELVSISNTNSTHSTHSINNTNTSASSISAETMIIQRGIKCPTSIWDTKGLVKLSTLKDDLKIIVGVRHPIEWFQSYYNYRVTAMHDKNAVVKPPPAESLIGSNNWRGVSTDSCRFELGLMQLGKIPIDYKELLMLGRSGRRVFPSKKFKIFLYSIEQLGDTNEERSKIFRHDLQRFLGLRTEIEEIPRSNVNHFVGDARHPETIDICEDRYKDLRRLLVKNGMMSNRWILSEFIHHVDVTVGGRDHFVRLIDSWGSDPCH
jgi:hypothetical protein